jgi:hypothetical protein
MLEPVDEFFHDNRIYANEFTLSENYIDFGASSCFSVVEPQVIRMHNNTKGKVTVTWFLPFDGDPYVGCMTLGSGLSSHKNVG